MAPKKAAVKKAPAKAKARPNPRKGKDGNPEPIDIHVGSRLHLRRSVLGMSQEDIAKALGLTFQQIQKYERGWNRVSASRLHQLSEALDVQVSYFFDGFNEKEPTRAYGFSENAQENFSWLEKKDGDLMERKETIELIRTYYQVQDEDVRKSFLKMLKTLVSAQFSE